jgi:hypothetical protein
MSRLGLGKLAIRGGALFAVVVSSAVACHGADLEAARAEREEDANLPCAQDEVREYFCDDLLPLSSSRPAPEPYDNCPSTADLRHGSFEPVGQIARFDPSDTAYTRRRVQPGHSCCYSWCAKVKVADASQAAPVACRDSNGLHEGFCMRELEGGTSTPSASPYTRCPVAVKPPEVVAFSAPSSALLDAAQTGQRRRDMQLPECCYGWCSVPPAGTVLKVSHPKIK